MIVLILVASAAILAFGFRGFAPGRFLSFWTAGEWAIFGSCLVIAIVLVLSLPRLRR